MDAANWILLVMPTQSIKPPTRGVFWRNMRAGDPIGRPLAEHAYITPRYPSGISESSLQFETPEIQRETALFWFFSNLKPYDLHGGHYFSFGVSGAGFDQAPFAPSPISVLDVLSGEFKGLLSDMLCQELGSGPIKRLA